MKFVIVTFLIILPTVAAQYGPEQIHLAITGVPGDMIVSWATNASTHGSKVVYGVDSSSFSQSASGEEFTFIEANHTILLHNVKISGLSANTTYFYKCGTDKAWSDVFSFKTLAAGYPPVDIAMYGDMGVVNERSLSYLLAEARAGTFDMIIHVGDMAYNLESDDGVRGDTFMRGIQPLAAAMPYMVCHGNHEVAAFFRQYSNRFSGITGKESGSNTNWWYSFDVSYVHFVAVSSEIYYDPLLYPRVAEQYLWLENDLKKAVDNRANVPWIVVFGHRPMYCSNTDDLPDCTTDAQHLRRGPEGLLGLEDILARHGVDLYVSAHEHSYERSFPVYKGQVDKQQNHTYVNAKYPVHIVSGAGGCQEDLDAFDSVHYGPQSAVRSATYGYAHLNIVNATHLHWRQLIDEGNQGQDELWLIKTAEHRQSGAELVVSGAIGDCSGYCYRVCSTAGRDNCVADCGCKPEAAAGRLESLGSDIRTSRDRVLKRG